MLTPADIERHTALHEAAHAVVYAALGYDVPAMVVVPHDISDIRAGKIEQLGMCLSTGQRMWPEDDIAISLAGVVVEYRIREDEPDVWMMLEAVDLHLFELKAEERCECDMCLAVRVARRMDWGTDDDEAFDAAVRKQLARSWKVAVPIVNQHWSLIETIADDLIARRNLSQEEVRRHCAGIMDASRGI